MFRLIKYLLGIVFLIVAIFILAMAMGRPADAKSKIPKTDIVVVSDWTNNGEGIREIKVNGRPCIQYKEVSGYAGEGGLSCRWN